MLSSEEKRARFNAYRKKRTARNQVLKNLPKARDCFIGDDIICFRLVCIHPFCKDDIKKHWKNPYIPDYSEDEKND
jgi:hypothetical protein